METHLNVKEILESLGYNIIERGDTLEMQALYRGGDAKRNLVVFPKSRRYYDRKSGDTGSLNYLLKLSGYKGKLEEEESVEIDKKPKFKHRNMKFPLSCLDRLVFDPT